MENKKILISTIKAQDGGVATMLEFVIGVLRKRNYEVTMAYYEPYSITPALSVPLIKLLTGAKPKTLNQTFNGCEAIAVGCWLPEFEFTQYLPTKHWKQIIKQHDIHLSVSGSCFAALAYTLVNTTARAQTPFLSWTATAWRGDRDHRVRTFPWLRRLFDRLFVVAQSERLEKKIIRTGNVVALSQYTRKFLNQVADVCDTSVLTMPIKTHVFCPLSQNEVARVRQRAFRIGFVGRFEDPRKNISLFLKSAAKVVQSYPDLEVLLVGDALSDKNLQLLYDLGIQDNVKVMEYVERTELPALIQTLDIFVLPSHQEGLCIAALEAMSCAVPVVSTRCGGPEDYLHNEENGLFCDSTVDSMSAAILQLLSDDSTRMRYSKKARQTVEEQHSFAVVEKQFWTLFDEKFHENIDKKFD